MLVGIEQRANHRGARRRPRAVPDTPDHRPTNPANTARASKAGPVATSAGVDSRKPAGATTSHEEAEAASCCCQNSRRGHMSADDEGWPSRAESTRLK